MKKILKAVCLATVFVMILSCSAFAATIQLDAPDVDKEAKTAVVSGKMSDPAADAQITIVVVESSTSLSNLSDDKIAYVDQAPVNEDGTFSFSLAINQEKFTGKKFTAYVGGTGVTSVSSAILNFGEGKKGDLTGDGFVDIEDYNLVVNNFNKPTFDERADGTGDGYVDIEDYNLVVNNFNT
ncbi:MAG: hypothetical protein E7399_00440 [Ruminococcaceae bacterium]|nr:hypothetical protein [Oscillospiraceae bacterium]